MPALQQKSKKPQGQITRGKTARNRLRRVDNFLLMHAPALLRERGAAFARAFFVDLGYGAEPFTTLECAERLRSINPQLPVLGVEIDPERVQRALPYADENTQFRLGGFNVPLLPGEGVRAIRAFNVLRQYEEAEVWPSLQVMGSCLLDGGLIIEGTSDPFGRIWVANLLRKRGQELQVEGLLFSTNFRWGFEPALFQPVLPKNHIHRMLPGEMIYEFMQSWKRATLETITYKDFGLRRWFAAAGIRLAGMGYSLDTRTRYLGRGYLLWKTDSLH
jgi:hypothetical protein